MSFKTQAASYYLTDRRTHLLTADNSHSSINETNRTDLVVPNGSALGEVTLASLLRNKRRCIFSAQRLPTGFTKSHSRLSSPLQLPPYLSYCHLHLHSGILQWQEAFISAAKPGADIERAALLQRTVYLSEHMHARGAVSETCATKKPSPRPHRRSEARGLSGYQWTAVPFRSDASA